MAAFADRRRPFAQIPARDLRIAVVGQLPARQLALHYHLKPRPLEMERLHAPLRCRALIEQSLKNALRHADGAFIRTEQHGELDAIALVVPSGVFGVTVTVYKIGGAA